MAVRLFLRQLGDRRYRAAGEVRFEEFRDNAFLLSLVHRVDAALFSALDSEETGSPEDRKVRAIRPGIKGARVRLGRMRDPDS